MDSDRRHELEQNALAQALTKAPNLLWEYGSYVLLALAVIVALFFYFRTRSTATIAQREAEAASLFNMAQAVNQAKEDQQIAGFLTADEVALRQAEAANTARGWARLPGDSERPGVRAHALRLSGDLAWTLGTFPEPQSASPATQPSTQGATRPLFAPTTLPATGERRTAEMWLAEAEVAYREVVEKYATQTGDALAALFGLAAIAEQRGQFDAAGIYYDILIGREDVGEGIKSMARQRKRLLAELALNPRLAKPKPPATQPATQSATQPATAASTLPATRPIAAPGSGADNPMRTQSTAASPPTTSAATERSADAAPGTRPA